MNFSLSTSVLPSSKCLQSLFVNSSSEGRHLLYDLRELLLNDLRNVGAWSFQNTQEAKDDPANLELELEILHKAKPVAEHEESLLLALHDTQSSHTAVVNRHA